MTASETYFAHWPIDKVLNPLSYLKTITNLAASAFGDEYPI